MPRIISILSDRAGRIASAASLILLTAMRTMMLPGTLRKNRYRIRIIPPRVEAKGGGRGIEKYR